MSRFAVRSALLASAFGIALAASPAIAQDGRYRDAAYQPSSSEEIQVIAPRYRASEDGQRLNGPIEKVSLSATVRYDDLNLRSRSGRRALLMRVRDTAQDVCMQLGQAYPVYEQNGTSCYKTALQNATLRANAAIYDARHPQLYRD
jgi:UrcA family protein